MKVRFLQDCYGTHGSFAAGAVCEIEDAIAEKWCDAKVCEKAPRMAPETAAKGGGEKAVKPAGLRRDK